MLALRRNDLKDQTETFPFEELSNDLQMKVLCKALFGNENLSSVNKSWKEMIKGIIHSALPMHKRDELIQGLYYRLIRFGNDQENERLNQLINHYQDNQILNSKSAVKFIYDFLKPDNLEDSSEDQKSDNVEDSSKDQNSEYESEIEFDSESQSRLNESKIQKIKEMFKVWELDSTIDCINDPAVYLKSLLQNRKIEEAFALAARMDEDKFAHSILIQEYLLDGEKGLGLSLDQAHKLTEALNTNSTRASAIMAFVIVGCKDFNIPAKVTRPIMNALMKHPFLRLIKDDKIKILPKSAVFYFIAKINSLLNCECKSFKSNEMICCLINSLFKVIPIDFDFFGEAETDSEECSDLIYFYQNPLYDDAMIPMSDKFMTKTEADKFIVAIDGIAHPGLKKQIFENIMEDFYLDQPDMRSWLQIIERIEKKTNQLPIAFQQLVLQYLNRDLKNFMVEFDEIDNFSRLVALLKGFPNWIHGFEPKAKYFPDKYELKDAYDRALNIYKVVVKLLINHDEKELAYLIIKKIKSEAMKIELKKIVDV